MEIRRVLPAMTVAAFLGTAACSAPGEDDVGVWRQEGLTFNGLTFNGLTFNGLTFNGLTFNGLTFNGLTFNGLTFNGAPSGQFADWFNNADSGNIALHDNIMKYVIGCAIAPGRTASFTDGNGLLHSWNGSLGLADSWDQNPPTTDQKQWVSACLMAHVNTALPAPKHIPLSVRGAAPGLATTLLEKGTFTNLDGVFFGDLFSAPNKRYLCRPTWTPPKFYESTLLVDWGRQCYFSSDGCGGLFTQVDCASACTATSGDTSWGPTCSVDGVTYNAVSAYLPRFKKAQEWAPSGGARVNTTCTGCLDGKALENFTSAASASVGGWSNNGSSGSVALDVRYSNGGSSTANLRLFVNGAAVMNGSSANWDFPVTGGWGTWQTRTISVSLPINATVKLQGPASGASPKVDAVSVRAQ
jgi:hypothetical protein